MEKRKAIFPHFLSTYNGGIDPQINPDDWNNHQKARFDALDRLNLDNESAFSSVDSRSW